MFCKLLPLLGLVCLLPSAHSATRPTKPTTVATYEPLAAGGDGRCTGNFCPQPPAPCTGFGCPTTPRPCTGFGCPVTTPMPVQGTTVLKAVVGFNTGNDAAGIRGYLELSQQNAYSAVAITGTLFGLIPNKRVAIHVHESGDIREGCTSSRQHFNPSKTTHGGPSDKFRHAGDLGNILADSNGKVTVSLSNTGISLNGPNSIIGRMLVIHEKEDDFGKGGNSESVLNGNSGMSMACGIVGIFTEV